MLGFGAFRPSAISSFASTSYLSFSPTALSASGRMLHRPKTMNHGRKQNMRDRMREVDRVIAAVAASGVKCDALTDALLLPTTDEMSPKDKYTTFNKRAKGYRKSVHLVPKFTRLSFRENPKGF